MTDMPTSSRGFTLVELLIGLVIVAILAAVALPSYEKTVLRARRVDAREALMLLLSAQERLRANCSQYAAALGPADDCANAIVGSPGHSASGYYEIRIREANATGFVAEARARERQLHDADCATLTVRLDAGSASMTPEGCW
jgi:type IV pilus assembly protein PilE